MEGVIHVLEVTDVDGAFGRFFQLALEPQQTFDGGLAHLLGGPGGELSGQDGLSGEQVSDVVGGERGHHVALAWPKLDEALSTQREKAFSHGRCAHLELFGDALLANELARPELATHDELAHVVRSLVTQLGSARPSARPRSRARVLTRCSTGQDHAYDLIMKRSPGRAGQAGETSLRTDRAASYPNASGPSGSAWLATSSSCDRR